FVQDAGSHTVMPFVHGETKPEVGFRRVVSVFVLQLVRPYLVAEPDTAALLHQIYHGTLALLLNHAYRLFELRSAVAPDRTDNIARSARRMHPHQHRFARFPRSLDEGHMFQTAAFLPERNEPEFAPLGRHGHLFALLDDALVLQTVSDDVRNGNDFQPELVRYLQQLGQTRHAAVLVHDFDKRSAGTHARHTRQVD